MLLLIDVVIAVYFRFLRDLQCNNLLKKKKKCVPKRERVQVVFTHVKQTFPMLKNI